VSRTVTQGLGFEWILPTVLWILKEIGCEDVAEFIRFSIGSGGRLVNTLTNIRVLWCWEFLDKPSDK